jgi:acylpyruvate hydrolase
MRLLSVAIEGHEQVAVREGDAVIPVSSFAPNLPRSIKQLLADDCLAELAGLLDNSDTNGMGIGQVEYLPLLPRPGKIICIGRNYAAHAAEGGADTPSFPEIFCRNATSLVAHNGSIIRPLCSDKLDFEGEVAFVIGKLCRHATESNALDFIAGYSLFNDATLRDYQRFSSQWTIGKNFDRTGAFGPELVTSDELPPGMAGLTLTTTLNDQVMQVGQIDDMVFSIRRIMAILSECMTLEAGDVVVTGTPSGVGAARKPPVWMQAGDTVAVEVDGLGKLINTVVDELE